jgi:glycosyltransferase involved in cell wall biosynthesis
MKILIVTETASMHAARWVNQLKDTGWDVHVFQALAAGSAVSEEFIFGNLHVPISAKATGNAKHFNTLPLEKYYWFVEREKNYPGLMQYLHEQYLLKLINEWQPDIIHSLGLNINWSNICLPVLRVLNNSKLKKRPRWLYSTWGTDLDFFAKMSKANYADVENVLKNVDYLVTECERDLRLSKEIGFKGKFLGYFTGFGGVSTELLDKFDKAPKASTRKTILLKGRSLEDGDPVGRAMTAIKAFKLCEDLLKDYRIVIGSAISSLHINSEVELLRATTDLKIQILSYLPYDMLMDIYASARLYISLTVNDGIPSSILEAMSAGAFPIHSDLEPIREIITDGKNGLLVDPEDVVAVADALRMSLINNKLVDNAQSINKEIIQNTFSERVVKNRVIKMYQGAVLENKLEQNPATNDINFSEIIPMFEIIHKAIEINDERVYGIVFRAMEINNESLYWIVSRTMNINNYTLYRVVSFAIKSRGVNPFRLLFWLFKRSKKS